MTAIQKWLLIQYVASIVVINGMFCFFLWRGRNDKYEPRSKS